MSVNVVTTRKLSDLYRRGIEIAIGDESEEEPVRLWLQKLNPVENESAIRSANMVRVRLLMAKRDSSSDEYVAMMADVVDYDRDQLIEYLASFKIATEAEALEAEVAEADGWTKDDYLQSLHDSWEEGGLKERYHAQETKGDDVDAQRCFDEIERYTKGVQKRLDQETENAAADYGTEPTDKLIETMVEQLFKMQGDLQWILEYRKQELFFGVRCVEDHKQRYFTSRDEIDELESEVVGRLVEEFAALNVSGTQGKDLPQTEDSSSAPKPPEMAMAGAPSSGPVESVQ